MSALSTIEWTDRTWNPVRGCSVVSPGCANCYAMKFAHRFSGGGKPYEGLTKQTKAGPQWTGKVTLVEAALTEPLRWKKPQRVFVNSMSDLFHEAVPDEFIDRVFAVMALAPQHTFQILTKRPKRMRAYLGTEELRPNAVADVIGFEHEDLRTARALIGQVYGSGISVPKRWPLPNVWLGVSCEDQQRADERIPHLLKTPAAVKFVSAEPLLGPVDLSIYLATGWTEPPFDDVVNWVIVGGESGPGARRCDVAWIRQVVLHCADYATPVFVKQLGSEPRGFCDWKHHNQYPPEWLDKDGCLPSVSGQPAVDLCHSVDDSWGPCKPPKLVSRKGGDPAEWPADLRVRQFPGEVA